MKKISFKVWCDKKKTKFYWVHIFKNREEMHKWNKDNGCEVEPNYEGITRSFKRLWLKDGRWKHVDKKEQGCVCFHVETVGAGIVSHEFTHAALYWFHAKHINYKLFEKPKYDEMLAWVQGNLVNQFWKKWYELLEQKRIKELKRK